MHKDIKHRFIQTKMSAEEDEQQIVERSRQQWFRNFDGINCPGASMMLMFYESVVVNLIIKDMFRGAIVPDDEKNNIKVEDVFGLFLKFVDLKPVMTLRLYITKGWDLSDNQRIQWVFLRRLFKAILTSEGKVLRHKILEIMTLANLAVKDKTILPNGVKKYVYDGPETLKLESLFPRCSDQAYNILQESYMYYRQYNTHKYIMHPYKVIIARLNQWQSGLEHTRELILNLEDVPTTTRIKETFDYETRNLVQRFGVWHKKVVKGYLYMSSNSLMKAKENGVQVLIDTLLLNLELQRKNSIIFQSFVNSVYAAINNCEEEYQQLERGEMKEIIMVPPPDENGEYPVPRQKFEVKKSLKHVKEDQDHLIALLDHVINEGLELAIEQMENNENEPADYILMHMPSPQYIEWLNIQNMDMRNNLYAQIMRNRTDEQRALYDPEDDETDDEKENDQEEGEQQNQNQQNSGTRRHR